ncbi:glycoside hydrolase family 3 C-terminal domain-containing protein [Dysgonomonas sp. Marseille-P4677]|uniref:beta-glucosidase n=1 Tax=Dysgonomonas sp. Marseille-P4677 TaxID=2364790 RepID=UPI001911FB84|nr:glycoside hydrolase family 3 C-terminal domain-containing protein [Dysgonomonas sp. Marseille-P4677]MBK5721145.1 glycoside hydrolase family 3 C-terminal domain-containing protein [Dysgonomonas sp. Marseille-P4677]
MKKLILYGLIGLFALQMKAQNIPIPLYLDDSKPIEVRVEDALSRLTLEEKIAMIHAQSKFSTPGVPRLGIPEIWMSDGPHGVRMEIDWDTWNHAGWTNDSCTAFPALTCLAATFNPELSMKYGNAVGEEARFRKKDIILGPGVNIYRTPMNGRNFEYMGEDPYLASKMVVPYIKGVQQNGVSACLKHFALNNQELWRGHIDVEISDRALYEIYLPAFKAGVMAGGVWTVMGSYNKYRGQYCSHHERLIDQILKGEWKYDGIVVTDWGSAHDTREAALYGLDVEMGTWTNGLTWGESFAYDNYYLSKPYLKMIEKGELPISTLDDKVRRVLRLNFRTNMDRKRPFGSFATQEHAEISRKIAEEGIVLMKNTNNFFPIVKDRYKKIVVIGENATRSLTVGGGSSELKVKKEVSPLEGLKAKYGADKVFYTMGYGSGPSVYDNFIPSPYNTDSLKREALALAKDADVVLFIGGLNKSFQQDCEGADRISYDLPFGQNELIADLLKINKNTGVILISGNAVAMPWLDKVPALIQSWYLGSEAGNATANVISGDVNPSGKLPFSIPRKLEDNGAISFGAISYPGDSIRQVYKEDILVGYRWHDTKKIPALFPFGYGLSYTTFDYGKITTDKKEYSKDDIIKVSFTLSNNGGIDGAESVQLYASQNKPSLVRPAKELKAFKKVYLKSGESKTVELTLPVRDLAFFDDKAHSWVVESDKFTLHCGTSSADIKSSIVLEVK